LVNKGPCPDEEALSIDLLFLYHTIVLPTVNKCCKFQPPTACCSWDIELQSCLHRT